MGEVGGVSGEADDILGVARGGSSAGMYVGSTRLYTNQF